MVLPSVHTELVDVSSSVDAPCRFLYKKENQQPSGSFKLRGMSRVITRKIEQARALGRDVHVFSSSGGNAGLAAAYASEFHGVPCTVALPVTSKQTAIDKLKDLRAEVVVHGAHWGEADTYLTKVIIADLPPLVTPVYCHPFENDDLWDGHAEMVDEIPGQLRDLQIEASKVKGIVCSCGGGGLYNGIVSGLQRNQSLLAVPVLVIETKQTPSFKSAVEAGKVVTLSKIYTLATSLAAPYIAQRTLDNYSLHPTTVELLEDLEAVEATVAHYDKFRELIEPACGATVAVSTKRKDLLKAFGALAPEDVVIFIVCGGSTVSPETMESYRELLALK
ncbi:tryptophan synthase beta subunit-like PLP-dependent enzyme [Metschnikowia bicuspidata var. bicuspidata NRRL YB-4993]|uniref:L-serine ammonia-lyase n=1 Tax=Metschnikowia bicuspidata var. bicuspidata NRRL YB-4993 TaxID=869754 RepID=A0A1A0HEZ0_9ASCO|nr:tryptophan synthase beta subunit-like PLP-dependent enzyme [Metschnikowia bicuspidata var. bicuspidata NRRL YB-4993]OBA22457.1 tryptophan synthase beta subunit-like PLP-dependent enzyme [Metschnikowia bicuspidata var. bicuspidata NRRL YB-4993]